MGIRDWIRDRINPIIEEPQESFEEQEARTEARLEEAYAASVAGNMDDAANALAEELSLDENPSDEAEDVASEIDAGDVEASILLEEDEKLENFVDGQIGEFNSEEIDMIQSDSHLINAELAQIDEDEELLDVEIINTDVSDDDFEILNNEEE